MNSTRLSRGLSRVHQFRVHLEGTSSLADLRGGRAPPLGPSSFIFMQFSEKIWPNNGLAPPPWRLAPPVGEILDPPTDHSRSFPMLSYNPFTTLCNTILLL